MATSITSECLLGPIAVHLSHCDEDFGACFSRRSNIFAGIPIGTFDLWLRRRSRDPYWLMTDAGQEWIKTEEGRRWQAQRR